MFSKILAVVLILGLVALSVYLVVGIVRDIRERKKKNTNENKNKGDKS